MENEISKILNIYGKQSSNWSQTNLHLKQTALKMWGGYDKCRSFKDLENKRIYYLIYGILNDFSGYINFSECNPTFKDFCDNFGYEFDSRKAEKIYKDCLKFEENIKTLCLLDSQKEYFLNIVATEEDKFKKDLIKTLNLDIKD